MESKLFHYDERHTFFLRFKYNDVKYIQCIPGILLSFQIIMGIF
jgi:hypothetical protein